MSLSNPFTPGFGSVPPHMAGRDPEHKLLKEALAAITGPRQDKYGPLQDGSPPMLKIVGPRGVGKTALQTWAGREARSLEVDVDVEKLAWLPKGMAEDEISGLLGRMATIQGLSWKQLEAQAYKYFQMTRNPRAGPLSMHDFKDILEARLRFRPLLLLMMDEVMHYDVGLLGQMLHQSQVLIDEGWPLAVVLAGIPTLDAHLDKVDARFIYRTKDIYINLLDTAATRATMSRPFSDRGIAVLDEALELMASWTDNYSYFTQVVGKQVWDAKEKAGCAEVNVALVQSVEEEVWEQRLDIYGSIYERIGRPLLLEQARKVVAAIEAAPELLTPEELCACMATGTDLDAKGALAAYNKLLHAGLIWADGDARVQATLPSFFDYFKKEEERQLS